MHTNLGERLTDKVDEMICITDAHKSNTQALGESYKKVSRVIFE